MNTLGNRIQQLRKNANLSQTQLAELVKISYPQMSRYEIKGVQPPADVLKRIADALNTSVDYLVNGDSEEKAQASLKDTKLLSLFKAVEKLEQEDQNVVMRLINAFIFQKETQQRLVHQ